MKIAWIALAATLGYSHPGYAQQTGSAVVEASPTAEENRSALFLLPACEKFLNN
jgi:hypothetical protein